MPLPDNSARLPPSATLPDSKLTLEPVLPAVIDTSPALPLEVDPVLIAILPDAPRADEPLLIDTEPLLTAFVAEAVETTTDSPTLL